MKKLFGLLGILTFTLLSAQASGIDWSSLNVEKAIAKANAEHKLVFIDVFATWCGPCKYLDKKVFPDAELGAYFNAHFVNLELDGERGEGPQIIQRYGVEGFPTLLFIDGDGKLIHKQVGALDAPSLLQMGREVVDPTSSPVYQMKQAFAEGKRDKAFLSDYMIELLQRDKDPTEPATAYAETHPELDLDTEIEFLVFLFGVHDLDHPVAQTYLANIKTFENRFPESGQYKIGFFLKDYGARAIDARDPEIGLRAIRAVHPALKKLLGKEVPKLKEMQASFREAYAAEVSTGAGDGG
ncbi:MAG: thioredoxin family protein [Bacteroidota bacterium]